MTKGGFALIELLFVACMAATPTNCEERNLIYQGIAPMTCLIAAQAELAKWSDRNPGYTIASWTCRRLRHGARET